MRIGLVGNGYWARVTHAAGLQAQPAVELAGVWGRDPAKSDRLAGELGITAYREVDALLADVDAVAFSVPPQVQAELALRAAKLGRHLLLEKPIAVSVVEAARLSEAIERAGVASVVFFTGRFDAAQRGWLAEAAGRDDWDGGSAQWLGSAFDESSPFDTPWRHDKGGLWDVGPHVLAMLSGALGPVVELTARAGRRDLVHLLLRHRDGATSTASLSIDTPKAAAGTNLSIWGPAGRWELPPGPSDPAAALATAAGELAAAAAGDRTHPCDVRLGLRVVELLAEAEQQLGRD